MSIVAVGGCVWSGAALPSNVVTIVSHSTAEGHAAAYDELVRRGAPTNPALRRVRVPHSRDAFGVTHFFRQDAPEDAEFVGYVCRHDPDTLETCEVDADELRRLSLSAGYVHVRLPSLLSGLDSIEVAALRALESSKGPRTIGELAACVASSMDVDEREVETRVWALSDPMRNNDAILANDVPFARRGWGAKPEIPLRRVSVRLRRRDWAVPSVPPCVNHLGSYHDQRVGIAVVNAREQFASRLRGTTPPSIVFGYVHATNVSVVEHDGGRSATCVAEGTGIPVGAPENTPRVVVGGGRVVSTAPLAPIRLEFFVETRDAGVFRDASDFLDAWTTARLARAARDVADELDARSAEFVKLETKAEIQRAVVTDPAVVLSMSGVVDRVCVADLNVAALERTIAEIEAARLKNVRDVRDELLARASTDL
jgi:hypothetical protein